MNNIWLIPEHMQRLWFVYSTAQNKGLLNIGADIVIKGKYNLEELRSAFTAAIYRHDAFRTRFNIGPSGVECQLLEEPIIRWQIENVSAYSGQSHESFHTLIADKESAPLPVEKGSPIRGTLYLFGKGLAVLAVTAHHLVADAWTIRILIEDMLHEWRQLRGESLLNLPPQGSICSILAQPNAYRIPQETSVLECSQKSSFTLPLDHVVSHDKRTGNGAEIVITLDKRLSQKLRQLDRKKNLTLFAKFTGSFFLHLSEVCATQTVEAGILITIRNLRHNQRTAGCFVHASPLVVTIPLDATAIQVIEDVNKQLQKLRGQTLQNHTLGTKRFPIMISMVRDSLTHLIGPDGIGIHYERRIRTQAECDLHVFFYQHNENVDIIFNYDSDVLNADTVSSWAKGYVQLLNKICRSPMIPLRDIRTAQRIHALKQDPPHIDCNLQHIGLAAWELDIGLQRLAAVGIFQHGKSWEDHETGVAMALAGLPKGLQLEVIAPMHANAPCVGALTRDGEGPYHCCWRVSNVNDLLSAMTRLSIKHTVIRQNGESDLFPSEKVTFVVIEGFVLVEFLDHVIPNSKGRKQNEDMVRIGIKSDNMTNARLFLQLMGYCPYEMAGPDSTIESWAKTDAGHIICLVPANSQQASMLAWVDYPKTPEPASICRKSGSIKMSTTWWARLRLGN